MERNEKRYVVAQRQETRFTKRAHAEIEKMIAGSQFCQRWIARNNKHEVKLGNDTFTVDMNAQTCGCRKWQMTGIPCVHAASVIIGKKERVQDYVKDWYTTAMWRLTYKDGIEPVQSDGECPPHNRLGVIPPPFRRGNPRRPSNHDRRKGVFESAATLGRAHRIMTCGNYKEEGHNRQGCQNERVTSPPKRPRGRPRKSQEPRNILFGQGQAFQPSKPEPSQGEPSLSHGGEPQRGRGGRSQRGRGGRSQRGRGGRLHGGGESERGEGSHSGWESTGGEGTQRGEGSQGGLEGWRSWFECSS